MTCSEISLRGGYCKPVGFGEDHHDDIDAEDQDTEADGMFMIIRVTAVIYITRPDMVTEGSSGGCSSRAPHPYINTEAKGVSLAPVIFLHVL